ncbi:hypothetical protein B0H13DRAFT_1851213 [Mycena leptocephala]|nr:hypothetical protein B0H13DRAFT_1851213 [Mycena leptocephala]
MWYSRCIHVSFIRGRKGAMGLFKGNSKLPQAKCHERIHKITRTTPGAIVTASILYFQTIWLYSADTTREGNETTVIDTASDVIFGQARSAVERTAPQVTSPPQDNHKDDLQAGHPRLPHPRIHATSLQAHRNCHPAPSPMVSSTIKPTAHHLPDADYSSPCLDFKAPTCTTRKCRLAILIPTGCSPEPLSQRRAAWTELFCSSSNNLQPVKTSLKVYNPPTGFEWIVTNCNPTAGLEPGSMHLTQVLQATKKIGTLERLGTG